MASSRAGLLVAIALPLAACAVQWVFWAAIKPFAWFLFFPAVFLSAWVGGLRGALAATLVSTALAAWFFIFPERGFSFADPLAFVSIALFMAMGVLFGVSQERVRRADAATAQALAAAEAGNASLHEANAKITELYEKTLELDRLKSEFFANVSHELRTPLTLILGPTARRLAATGLAGDERRLLELIERNARLLFRHVSDLLDIARLEAGHMPMQYGPADLAQLARLAASHFEGLAEERRLDFAIDAPDELPAIVDAAKCERILLNLLSNAFKFTPAGGRIELSLRAAGGQAVLCVLDNGPGIPQDLRDAVFERFRQVDGGAERSFGGTGLGLSIVREFCALHGGSVELAEAPTGGACFTVTLPLRAPGDISPPDVSAVALQAESGFLSQVLVDELRAPPRPATAAAVPAARVDAALILVVEDNADMNAFLVETLAERYRVASAYDGQEGVDRARQLHPDLILSDLMMPRLSGLQLVAELAKDAATRGIPVVMLSAKADDALTTALLDAGVRDYIAKPFAPEVLLARIGGILAERGRTESRLEESAAYASRIFNAAPNAMLVTDAQGRIERVNASAVQLFGYAAEVLQGSTVELLIPERFAEVHVRHRAAFVKDLRSRGMGSGMELFGRRQDGAEFPIDVGLAPTQVGGETRIIVTVQDISARKQAEADIRELNAELEQRVAERTAQLAAANQELESFSYSVSHDLKAPLRGIDGYSRLLEHDYRDRLDDEGRLFLRNIRQGTEQMHEMIEDMLAYSRMERRGMVGISIELAPLVDKLLAERAADIEELGATVEVDLGHSAVHADSDGLAAILRNLLENAIKFSRHAASPQIRIGARTDGGRVVVWVRDNGIGFDMKYHDRIFEIFSRLERSENYPGTGVGLAIVKKAVSRMNGRVWAESAPHEGATFFVELPA